MDMFEEKEKKKKLKRQKIPTPTRESGQMKEET